VAEVNQLFADAVAKHRAGEFAPAEQAYRAVLAEHPHHAPALCNLGSLLVKSNRFDEATSCYELALRAEPGYADAHFNLGNLYRKLERHREAVDQYLACLKKNPQHVAAGFNLGLAFVGVGDLRHAKQCFAQVVKLEPANADAWGRYGDVLLRSGEQDPAINAFQQYCDLKPNDERGQNNLALALANAGRHADATELLQKVVKKNPQYAEAHNTLGVTLEAIGRKDDAQFHYDAAVKAKPDFADAWSNRGINLLEAGRADEAIESLQKSVSLRPGVPAVHSNLLLAMNYSSRFTPSDVAAEHKKWATAYAGDPPAPPRPADPNPNRLLKIGYVSADYRTHTVAGFIEALLSKHDRTKFHVTAYPSVGRGDETTERLKKLADAWRPIMGISDEQAAGMIAADRIDILVDLGGHTAGNRMLTFARRPAPLQLTMFGYPNTTGLAAIDYRVTDPISDPPEATERLDAEQPLRLPGLAWVYQPPANAPAVTPLPAAGKKSFTFGCLNNAAKISDDCLVAWSAVLAAVPGSKLVLLAGQSNAGAKRLADRFKAAGILRDRVELVFRLPREQYFAAYQSFDLALDPFPYNGGITTCDAMWMGVPVLTVAGNSYASRQGLTVLAALGLPGFIARTPAELAELAKSWSHRRPELAGIRAELRDTMKKSAVCDVAGFVKGYEGELVKAWRRRMESFNA
jgi:protein O-GlcNAc transferase